MKINLWAAGLMLALTLLGSSLSAADDVELTSDFEQADPAPQAEVSNTYAEDIGEPTMLEPGATGACPVCGSMDNCNCNGNNWSPAIADKCPRFGSYITMGVDSWRGVTNGTTPNNNGFVTGVNGAAPLALAFRVRLWRPGRWQLWRLRRRRKDRVERRRADCRNAAGVSHHRYFPSRRLRLSCCVRLRTRLDAEHQPGSIRQQPDAGPMAVASRLLV